MTTAAAIRSKTAPWAHQQVANDFLLSHPRAYLAMGMGTGKTKIVVDRMVNALWRRVLIVCPKAVVQVWREQFAIHAASYVHVVGLESGTVAERAGRADAAWQSPHPVAIVINYAGLIGPAMRVWAIRHSYDAIIVDEAHHAKKPGGVLSRLLALLRSRTDNRIALSGTPLAHSPLDIYAQYRFLAPDIFAIDSTPCYHNPNGNKHEYVEEKEVFG